MWRLTLVCLVLSSSVLGTATQFAPKDREEFFEIYKQADSQDPERQLLLKFLPDSSTQLAKSAFVELLAASQLKMIVHNYDGVESTELNEESLHYDLAQQADKYLTEKHPDQKVFTVEDYYEHIHETKFFTWLVAAQSDL